MSKCEHGRQKSRCKDCGGSSICLHNRDKSKCKECGGSQICLHGRIKSTCKECGGSSICEHERRKSHCRDCKGSQICEHEKRKSRCKECKGSEICEHERRKSHCRDCKGSQICIHGRQKPTCKECRGNSICIHGRQKPICKECRGSKICLHEKRKEHCKECGGSGLCPTPLCESYKYKKYNGYCRRCCSHLFPDIPIIRNYKTKELLVFNFIRESFSDEKWQNDRIIQKGCSKDRPDVICDLLTHIIIIEIDENRHSSYDCSCENNRLMSISENLAHRPIVLIRFNPDSYKDINGKTIKSCFTHSKTGLLIVNNQKQWNIRLEKLKQMITHYIANYNNKTIHIDELFY